MQTRNSHVTEIRSTGLTRINQLVRAHRHLDTLREAFAEWAAGEVYVCKKTGDYRYRFGDRSKSVTPWSAIARQTFSSPEALAFAAMVMGGQMPEQLGAPAAPVALPASAPQFAGRVNVMALAEEAA